MGATAVTCLNILNVSYVQERPYRLSMTNRRPRTKRTRTGKRIEITPRDLAIFRTLARYRYLPSTYLHAIAGGASKTRFKERLGDLFHEGYLDRPEQQWEYAGALHRPAIHALGDRSLPLLETPDTRAEARTFLTSGVHRQFVHAVLVCECLASIELAAVACGTARFVSWPEILSRAPAAAKTAALPYRIPVGERAIVPDGLFGLEYDGGGRKTYRFFALEVDRATMPVSRSDVRQTSYLAKLALYRRIIATQAYRTQWGIPNLFVLTVTTSESHLAAIMQAFADRPECASVFLFKAIDAQVLAKPFLGLLREPWQRMGHEPLAIAAAN